MNRQKFEQIGEILNKARAAAVSYYDLTNKPLGITGEVGEYEAARLLNLDLAPAREEGYDATDSKGMKYQIKSRRITDDGKNKSQKLGTINIEKEWDAILMVLLDEQFRPTEIWEASRKRVETELRKPGSKSRERGVLSASKLKSIGKQRWPQA